VSLCPLKEGRDTAQVLVDGAVVQPLPYEDCFLSSRGLLRVSRKPRLLDVRQELPDGQLNLALRFLVAVALQ